MNLHNWINQASESWKENNPALFKELNSSGRLETALKEAAERTHAEMTELEGSGYSNQEAWELTREKYLFLPAEPQPDEVESKEASLFIEANTLQNRILQSLNEISIDT